MTAPNAQNHKATFFQGFNHLLTSQVRKAWHLDFHCDALHTDELVGW
jgi:hypothetical protein